MARVSMPTTNTKLSFVLNDFSGGLVNNVNDAKMKDNQSPDMLNMMFRVDGLLQKRPGTVFVNVFCKVSNICSSKSVLSVTITNVQFPFIFRSIFWTKNIIEKLLPLPCVCQNTPSFPSVFVLNLSIALFTPKNW